MPRGDGTGPMGMGPMTGRRAGYCSGFAAQGNANPVGFTGRFGCGRGRGNGNMFRVTGMQGGMCYGYPVYAGSNGSAFNEKGFLTNQAEFLENQLQQVKNRLSALNEEA